MVSMRNLFTLFLPQEKEMLWDETDFDAFTLCGIGGAALLRAATGYASQHKAAPVLSSDKYKRLASKRTAGGLNPANQRAPKGRIKLVWIESSNVAPV